MEQVGAKVVAREEPIGRTIHHHIDALAPEVRLLGIVRRLYHGRHHGRHECPNRILRLKPCLQPHRSLLQECVRCTE